MLKSQITELKNRLHNRKTIKDTPQYSIKVKNQVHFVSMGFGIRYIKFFQIFLLPFDQHSCYITSEPNNSFQALIDFEKRSGRMDTMDRQSVTMKFEGFHFGYKRQRPYITTVILG